ncbi:MAG: hypothetical protein O7A06_04935 [Acidobacteria bacterium]|nr:hypothetical protein [Acidobacteriota bacterium]
MIQTQKLRRNRGTVAMLAVVAMTAAWVLFSGKAEGPEWSRASEAALRRPTGYAQLVSYHSMPSPSPAMNGEMCQWAPASAETTLMASLRTHAASAADAAGSAVVADRAPARIIRDTYPTYSAIAVDTNSNEVYLLDENLFGFKVFDRLDNTPPTASFTEPKRMVGGINTKLEFNCGLYVDPKTGDIYAVNNDTVDTMVVFPRNARGNVVPQRELSTPHRTWGIAVDEEAQEIFLTVEHPPEVVVYRKMAEGDEQPIRTLVGNQTQLEDAHGIAIDTKNGWMFVSNHGSTAYYETGGEEGSGRGGRGRRIAAATGRFEPPSITVYPLKAEGDTPPLRIIEGPRTRLNWPAAMYMDEENGELYVANDADDSILVFRTTDSGNVAPTRVVRGSRTGIKNPTGIFVDFKNDELWVSNMGNHSATVFPRTANGNVAPLRTIRSAPLGKMALAMGNPGAVGYDSKREEILVPN